MRYSVGTCSVCMFEWQRNFTLFCTFLWTNLQIKVTVKVYAVCVYVCGRAVTVFSVFFLKTICLLCIYVEDREILPYSVYLYSRAHRAACWRRLDGCSRLQRLVLWIHPARQKGSKTTINTIRITMTKTKAIKKTIISWQ